jgi:hypothetical protein
MSLTAAEEAQTRELLAQQAAILSLADSEATIISKLGATKVNLSQLPAASTVADADLLLLRQGGTDKSVAGSIVKAYAGATIPDASETVKGIVELATVAETIAGTDTTRAVHPAGIQAKVASETAKGIIELATSAEAATGTDTDRAITPAVMRGGFNASGTAPVYAVRSWVSFDASSGTPTILASGNISSLTDSATGDITINFSTALPDANYSLTTGHIADGSAGFGGSVREVRIMSQSTSSSRIITGAGNPLAAADFKQVNVSIVR